MDTIIFIGGTGRCGTGVVKRAFARHPDAASLPFRCRFIIDPGGLVDFYRDSWSPYVYDRRLKRLRRFLHTLTKTPLYHRLCGRIIRRFDPHGRIISPAAYCDWSLDKHLPSFSRHVERLMSQLAAFSYPACWHGTESYQLFPNILHGRHEGLATILGNFIRSVVRDFLGQQTIFIDHNTYNVLFAKELLELLPESKILHVYRDPRDVIASYVNQRWCPKDKAQAACVYKDIMKRWWAVRAELPRNSWAELKFEDFITAPREYLESICQLFGFSFNVSMLSEDLSSHHIGRWKKEYTAEETAIVYKILGDTIERLGYT